jgi:putative component of toxin-antitoxin plasmid stabilization module
MDLRRKGNRLVLLLRGGDKGSQRRDIETARRYWMSFLEANDDGETE